jgi:Ohr subfamily peroxiredoxin
MSALALPPPRSSGPGTNPQPLFAAGYPACFGGAIGAAESLANVSLQPADTTVPATVNLNQDGGGYYPDVALHAEPGGIDRTQTGALVANVHTIDPHSEATRGDIQAKLQANGQPVERA